MDPASRHPSTQAALARLEVNSNLPLQAKRLAGHYKELGHLLADALPDDPDLTDALRKLWESKNCAVYLVVNMLTKAKS